MIKAELLPTLEQRVDEAEKEHIIQDELEKHKQELEKLKPKPDYIDKFNK